MKIYVGKWSLLPEEWEGINGLYEKSEDEIAAEISRQIEVDSKRNPYNEDNNIAVYTLEEFEDSFNSDDGALNGGTYFAKFFDDDKAATGR